MNSNSQGCRMVVLLRLRGVDDVTGGRGEEKSSDDDSDQGLLSSSDWPESESDRLKSGCGASRRPSTEGGSSSSSSSLIVLLDGLGSSSNEFNSSSVLLRLFARPKISDSSPSKLSTASEELEDRDEEEGERGGDEEGESIRGGAKDKLEGARRGERVRKNEEGQ